MRKGGYMSKNREFHVLPKALFHCHLYSLYASIRYHRRLTPPPDSSSAQHANNHVNTSIIVFAADKPAAFVAHAVQSMQPGSTT